MSRAKGEKVLDDTKMLKKTIKKTQKKKDKSKEKWYIACSLLSGLLIHLCRDARIQEVEKQKQEKQDKRRTNLKQRAEARIAKKMGVKVRNRDEKCVFTRDLEAQAAWV